MMAYSVTGEACDKFGRYHPANIEDYEYAKSFCTLSEALLGRGRLVPHPATVEQGGLRGVFDGMQQFRDGKVSGEKLVYRVEET